MAFPRQEYWRGLPFLPLIERKQKHSSVLPDQKAEHRTMNIGPKEYCFRSREITDDENLRGSLFPAAGNSQKASRIRLLSIGYPALWILRGYGTHIFPGRKLCQVNLKLPQFRSVAQLCLTLCDPMDCSTSGLPVHHQLSVHWVGDAIQPSHPLLFPSLPTFNLSQHFPEESEASYQLQNC